MHQERNQRELAAAFNAAMEFGLTDEQVWEATREGCAAWGHASWRIGQEKAAAKDDLPAALIHVSPWDGTPRRRRAV